MVEKCVHTSDLKRWFIFNVLNLNLVLRISVVCKVLAAIKEAKL